MTDPRTLRISDFTYDLPDERIARYQLPERDAARLLVYRQGQLAEDTYRNIAEHLPANTLMVYNQTKVVHARLLFRKESGSVIEVFCLAPHRSYADINTAMQQKGSVLWECMVGGASKWKQGMVLQATCTQPQFTLSARIAEREPGAFVVALDWTDLTLTFAEVLQHMGRMPLPPYLHRDAEAADETTYQTMFARTEGSVAAPTAALHFTQRVMDSLAVKGIDHELVTLHVGAGTFKPVKSEVMAGHDMHAEWLEVTAETVAKLAATLQAGAPIVAVGTTSLRTLESMYWIGNKLAQGKDVDMNGIAVTQWDPYEDAAPVPVSHALAALQQYMALNGGRLITRTQIIIAPGYRFRLVSGLVTNFHQPQSTLLLLVAALIGADWRMVYQYALGNGFRFLSYGDGSLLWGNQPLA